MRVLKAENYADLSRKAALLIAAQIIKKPHSVMGFATGSTPEGAYAELVALYKQGTICFKDITTFNLDEYYSLSASHSQSYAYFMKDKLFGHVDLPAESIHIPNGNSGNAAAECAQYEKDIEAAGGIDMQLLGIGRNGHIGFNEPDEDFSPATHLVNLTANTLDANARFFSSVEEVPTQAITMGVGTIMRAKSVLLIANGAQKKEIIQKTISGAVTPQVPASILQFHPDVTVLYCD